MNRIHQRLGTDGSLRIQLHEDDHRVARGVTWFGLGVGITAALAAEVLVPLVTVQGHRETIVLEVSSAQQASWLAQALLHAATEGD